MRSLYVLLLIVNTESSRNYCIEQTDRNIEAYTRLIVRFCIQYPELHSLFVTGGEPLDSFIVAVELGIIG